MKLEMRACQSTSSVSQGNVERTINGRWEMGSALLKCLGACGILFPPDGKRSQVSRPDKMGVLDY